MGHYPHEIQVFTCAEVLLSIYGSELPKVNVEEAKKVFEDWLAEHGAIFYHGCPHDADTLYKAILVAVQEKATIVVLSDAHGAREDEDDTDAL